MRCSSTRRLSLGIGLVAIVAIGAACTPIKPPSGPPPVLEIAPTAAALIDTPSGVGTTQIFTVANTGTGDSGALDVSIASVTGTGTWSVGNDSCDGQVLASIDPDASCTLVVQYENNTGTGAGQAQVVVVDTTRPSVSVAADLSGTGNADPPPGPAALSIAPAATILLDTPSGPGDVVEFTLTNLGGTATSSVAQNLTVLPPIVGEFLIIPGTCAAVLVNGLAPGSSCTTSVQYTNDSGSGVVAAFLRFVDNSDSSVGATAQITGQGIPD